MNLPTITDIKIKNSSGNKNSNTILVSTREFDPNTHRIILRVNNKFYDDLKYHMKDVVIDQGGSRFQLPGMNESLTIYAQLYDYKNDRIICTKKKDFTKILGSWGLALGDSIMSTQNDYFNLFWNSNRKVVKVNGPFDEDGKLQAEVKPGERYYFTAQPNQKLHDVELLSVKWSYRYDDGELIKFKNHNEIISSGFNMMDCIFHNEPKKIKVYAYFFDPNEKVMVEFSNFEKPQDMTDGNDLTAEETKKSKVDTNQAIQEKLNNDISVEEARVRAFMRMLRKGEGTNSDSGYSKQYSGIHFKNFKTHPEKVIKAGNYSSSAAGAYQIMRYTWWWLNGEELTEDNKKAGIYNEDHDYVKRYKIPDFSPESQDKLCIILLKHKKTKKFLDLIISNKIQEAIEKYGSYEWASLPPGRYGQPTQTMDGALQEYKKCFAEEVTGKSTAIKLKRGFLKEFGYELKKEQIKESEKSLNKETKELTLKTKKTDINLRNKVEWQTQFSPKWGDKKKQNTACKKTCDDILIKTGLKATSLSNLYQTAIENKDHSKLIIDKEISKKAIQYLDKELEKGHPVQVGVDHDLGYKVNNNADHSTDHFIIIIGRGYENNNLYYLFYDVGTSHKEKGANDKNRLFFNSVDYSLVGKTVYNGNTYTVTQIRINK